MEFANLLKTNRESSGLTQSEAAEQLNVTEKTISNWETGAVLPPTDKCQGIGKVYGIERGALLTAYNNAVWPSEYVPDDFPTFLFVDAVLPYVTNLNFSPQEIELIRMLEIYHTDRWEFSSLNEAYELLRSLPYAYISRIGVSALPQMMMDISKKLWPTVNAESYSKSYDSTFQQIVINAVMLPQEGNALSAFSVFNLPLKDILGMAKRLRIESENRERYYVLTDNHTIAAIKLISQGKTRVCIAQTRLNNNGTDYMMDPEWEDVLQVSRYSYCPKDDIEKNSSPWISYEWNSQKDQSSCMATPSEKGQQLLSFYQKHAEIF